ncbi:MAG: flippase [Lachnospiraceae bacterium]|nr:flippase [Lachnospiraceae bacterium]
MSKGVGFWKRILVLEQMMEKKSLGVNFIFSVLKTLMGVVFPLITFPYALRVLGPDYIGKIDYAYANVTYFSLIGAFGISGYAVREGSRLRDDKEKISQFASEMLAINLVTVTVAYVLCFLAMCIPKFAPYRGLMLIFSSTIALTAVGLEWLYNIFEEYKYITIRSFVFQVISLVTLFCCVKDENDYVIYAITLILSSVGSNIMNLIRSRKYIKLRLSLNNFKKHIKPMFAIFSMTVASTIILSMDKTMLGYITENDTEVGLYAATTKIVVVFTSVIAVIRTVMMPRVSYFMETDKSQADKLNYFSVKLVAMLSIPIAVGMVCLSDEVLVIFAGKEFIDAHVPLRILMVNLVIAVLNGIVINQVFISNRKDKWASIAVIIGAIVNLVFNLLMIPVLGKAGAAISTLMSETSIFLFACIVGRGIFKVELILKQVIQSLLASVPMIGVYYLFKNMISSDIIMVLATVLVGAIVYFAMLFLIKSDILKELIAYAKKGNEKRV